MSGHNKWSTIKHKKGRADAKRGIACPNSIAATKTATLASFLFTNELLSHYECAARQPSLQGNGTTRKCAKLSPSATRTQL